MKKTITSKEACTLAHQIKKNTGCTLAEAFKLAYNGQTEPTPKTSWTRAELDQIFSDKAAELLRKGYMIDTMYMAGHQGEVAKLRFYKGKDHYQLIMDYTSNWDHWYSETYHIRFGKYTEEVRKYDTLWVNKFDTTWSLEAWKITDNYFVAEELAEEIASKRRERSKERTIYGVVLGEEYHKAVLPLIRKQKGRKGTKLSNIVKVQRVSPMNYMTGKPMRRYYLVTIDKHNGDRPENVEIKF